jgi:GGDEF domain-containing protein
MAGSESNRARRFALPAMDDERGGESIEAFLEGPNVRKHRPVARRWRPESEHFDGDAPAGDETGTARTTGLSGAAEAAATTEQTWQFSPDAPTTGASRPPTELRSIPGRLEWTAALARESLRAARYGRPAAVAIIELQPEDVAPAERDQALRRLSGAVAQVLRRDSRATDLVARVAAQRFQVLLPETDEASAARYGDRASSACRRAIEGVGGRASVRVSVAAATGDHSLDEAVAHALRTIEAA